MLFLFQVCLSLTLSPRPRTDAPLTQCICLLVRADVFPCNAESASPLMTLLLLIFYSYSLVDIPPLLNFRFHSMVASVQDDTISAPGTHNFSVVPPPATSPDTLSRDDMYNQWDCKNRRVCFWGQVVKDIECYFLLSVGSRALTETRSQVMRTIRAPMQEPTWDRNETFCL